ncbi:hypothetical protein [[Clostridium] aminophilum]|uniref:hypothetical protein n=1 Tax=[Clostridium] aminophilum TaxID=1526 RepID=UPI003330B751
MKRKIVDAFKLMAFFSLVLMLNACGKDTHKAQVVYNNTSVEITLKDNEYNCFDLTQYFEDFNPEDLHVAEVENSNHDLYGIFESEGEPDSGFFKPSVGKYLILTKPDYEKTNDKYHFSDDLVITIEKATPAASIDWGKHMEFVEDSNYSTMSIYGMLTTVFEMDVMITNPSDETVYGSITKFYVNDKAVDERYLSASEHVSILPGDTGKLYKFSSGVEWETTGETNVKKFGLKVKIEDKNGNILYHDVQWLHLK